MNGFSFMLNRVSAKVVRIHKSMEIPDELRLEADINGELTLYHAYDTTDGRHIWMQWSSLRQAWESCSNPPDIVQLARMMVT